jgi:hypothetical protein
VYSNLLISLFNLTSNKLFFLTENWSHEASLYKPSQALNRLSELIFIYRSSTDDSAIIYGIAISHEGLIGCGSPKEPTVFTRVVNYLSWIQKYMKEGKFTIYNS